MVCDWGMSGSALAFGKKEEAIFPGPESRNTATTPKTGDSHDQEVRRIVTAATKAR